ncbi:class III poly(R)-hydroxyalkanoic acid synthase subunit PhaC [Halovenus salina]|nr:class III poly(R)-hydroxyalkanoic acid synthase subunit PhaC [Halovenus salina]
MSEDLPAHLRQRLAHLAARAIEQGPLPEDRLTTLFSPDVGHTDSKMIYEENKLELHYYEPAEKRHETPICLVYALVNRPYILDLQPDRSVIGQLLDAGFEVYLIDWGEPSRLDTTLGLEDYVCRYLDNCVSVITDRSTVDSVHLLGYCMGGSLALMYTARFQQQVRTLSLMATPVVFDDTGGLLERWAQFYDPEVVAETYGNVPAELLAAQFAMMEPVENLLTKYVQFFEKLDDEAFVEMFARMERWTWDGVDVAGQAFTEFVDDVYRNNDLIAGEITLCGECVDPADVDVPLLQIVGQYDHIVPPASSEVLNDVVASEDERLITFSAGHIGISVSERAHEQLWPEVCRWLAQRDVFVPEESTET